MSYRDIAPNAAALFAENGLRLAPVDDADDLIDLVASCSDQGRFMRFHTGMAELRPAMAERLTDLAPDRGQAVGMWTTQGRLVADSRYMRLAHDVAEVAILVADDYQGRGLGKALLAATYAVAADEGVATLHADVMGGNDPMVHIMSDLGPVLTEGYEDGVRHLCLPLTEAVCSVCSPVAIPA